VPFVALKPNERICNPHEQIYLLRSEGGHYLLQTLDNTFFLFGEGPEDNPPVPLQRIENAYGHFLHFTRTADGQLTDISATGGSRVHLHYEHPLGRLTSVKRIVGDTAVETLVAYNYDTNGQLCITMSTCNLFWCKSPVPVITRGACHLKSARALTRWSNR
jgi:hypothetical protein